MLGLLSSDRILKKYLIIKKFIVRVVVFEESTTILSEAFKFMFSFLSLSSFGPGLDEMKHKIRSVFHHYCAVVDFKFLKKKSTIIIYKTSFS